MTSLLFPKTWEVCRTKSTFLPHFQHTDVPQKGGGGGQGGMKFMKRPGSQVLVCLAPTVSVHSWLQQMSTLEKDHSINVKCWT